MCMGTEVSAGTDAVAHTNTGEDANALEDANADTNADAHMNAYSYADAYAYAFAVAYADADADADAKGHARFAFVCDDIHMHDDVGALRALSCARTRKHARMHVSVCAHMTSHAIANMSANQI
jgi:hypothetical protein